MKYFKFQKLKLKFRNFRAGKVETVVIRKLTKLKNTNVFAELCVHTTLENLRRHIARSSVNTRPKFFNPQIFNLVNEKEGIERNVGLSSRGSGASDTVQTTREIPNSIQVRFENMELSNHNLCLHRFPPHSITFTSLQLQQINR